MKMYNFSIVVQMVLRTIFVLHSADRYVQVKLCVSDSTKTALFDVWVYVGHIL